MILTGEFLFEELYVNAYESYEDQCTDMLESLYLLEIEGTEIYENIHYIEGMYLDEIAKVDEMREKANQGLKSGVAKIVEWIKSMAAKITVFINRFNENTKKVEELDVIFKKVSANRDLVEEYIKDNGLTNKPYIKDVSSATDKAIEILTQLTNLKDDPDAQMKMSGKENLNAKEIDNKATDSGWVVMENKLVDLLQELASKKKVISEEKYVDFSVSPLPAHTNLVLKSRKLSNMINTVYKNYKNKVNNVQNLSRGEANDKTAPYNSEGIKHAKSTVSLATRILALMISLSSNHLSNCTSLVKLSNKKNSSEKNL